MGVIEVLRIAVGITVSIVVVKVAIVVVVEVRKEVVSASAARTVLQGRKGSHFSRQQQQCCSIS